VLELQRHCRWWRRQCVDGDDGSADEALAAATMIVVTTAVTVISAHRCLSLVPSAL
jgi:hypothetical protein